MCAQLLCVFQLLSAYEYLFVKIVGSVLYWLFCMIWASIMPVFTIPLIFYSLF